MSDGRQLLSFVCCGVCGAQLNTPHAEGCPYRYEQIDLTGLETVARAADKQEPGSCWHLVASDGALIGSAAHKHVEENDPATTLSLIRRIRELEDALAAQLGPGPSVLRTLLDKGATRYGSMDPVTDHWDVDRPAAEGDDPGGWCAFADQARAESGQHEDDE